MAFCRHVVPRGRQNELATKGIQHGGHKMSAEPGPCTPKCDAFLRQAKTFEASPFMVKARSMVFSTFEAFRGPTARRIHALAPVLEPLDSFSNEEPAKQ